ncbi:MAG: IS1595 family transposase [Candidatus Sulfotelmatobacter sp.]
MTEPKSLQEAVVFFSNPDNCIDYLAVRRWPNGVICPGCGSTSVSFNAKRRTWKCSTHHAKREFSIKIGTVMEDSAIPLDKWMVATWLVTNCKNGISSYEIARDVKVTQKSAWFMLHRIRLAMQDDFFGSKLGGEVEVDETFIGGKARNMHVSERKRRITGTGGKDKTAVMGLLERESGKVRATVVPSRKRKVLQEQVRKHVTAGAALYSDALQSYEGLATEYAHQVVDHATQYVDGRVHTNGLENFWSLLKRGISGTYVSVEPFHLFRYLDEQMFRFNNRKDINDAGRFEMVVSQLVGKRLTFAELTGKVGETIH